MVWLKSWKKFLEKGDFFSFQCFKKLNKPQRFTPSIHPFSIPFWAVEVLETVPAVREWGRDSRTQDGYSLLDHAGTNSIKKSMYSSISMFELPHWLCFVLLMEIFKCLTWSGNFRLDYKNLYVGTWIFPNWFSLKQFSVVLLWIKKWKFRQKKTCKKKTCCKIFVSFLELTCVK